jgi:uncharacterized membrane protein YkvA (DUF1232 family)
MADEKRRIPVRARLDEDDDDDLVGPRSGAAAREDDDDLVGPRTRAAAQDDEAPRPRARRAARDDDDLVGPRTRTGGAPRPRPRRNPRLAAKRARRVPVVNEIDLRGLVREIPHFLRLLWGLARDSRVSKADKAIVVGAIAYAALPADLIPDWIPGLGEVEDVFLVALALSRLLANAPPEVIEDYWEGDDEALEHVLELLDGATRMLPGPIRGLLVGRG